jgi:hypothetical protein
MKIYLLLTVDQDGDTYWFSFDMDEAIIRYKFAVENSASWHSIFLAECEPGVEMGFDRDGDFYGGNVLMEFRPEEEED